MLTDRTEEQLAFLEEDKEAAYFSSPEELADKVRFYLARDAIRARIAEAGRRRVISGHNTYRDRLETILEFATSNVRRPSAARALSR